MLSVLLPIIYIAFVSLGLPDSLLGSAWPVMYSELGAPVAAQSAITMIITACTIISSLATSPLERRFGAGKLTAISVGMTAAAIFGFGMSTSLWQLCLIAVPYGLGAGSVDAVLNNFVALHYGERHMSWLHCCWGIGTSISPQIMGWAIVGPLSWHGGYFAVGVIQAAITALLIFSLPLWSRAEAKGVCSDSEVGAGEDRVANGSVSYLQALKLPGAVASVLSFGCYSGFEYACGLWSSSHLVLARGIGESQAAAMASYFYMGITVGRLVSGAVALHFGSKNLIRIGQVVVAAGVALLLAGQGELALSCALGIIGLGCAPIYPSIISLTPHRFGERASQSMVSLQMACAYTGSTLVPPVIALIFSAGGSGLFPWILAGMLIVMAVLSEVANARIAELKRQKAA